MNRQPLARQRNMKQRRKKAQGEKDKEKWHFREFCNLPSNRETERKKGKTEVKISADLCLLSHFFRPLHYTPTHWRSTKIVEDRDLVEPIKRSASVRLGNSVSYGLSLDFSRVLHGFGLQHICQENFFPSTKLICVVRGFIRYLCCVSLVWSTVLCMCELL